MFLGDTTDVDHRNCNHKNPKIFDASPDLFKCSIQYFTTAKQFVYK